MIDDLRPYPKYKDSGLPWLGRIPDSWRVVRIKSFLREVDDRTTTGRETLLSLRMRVGLVDHAAAGGKVIQPSALIGYKRTTPGHIVMNRMRAASGLFAVTPSLGLVSPDYAVFHVSPLVDPHYYVRLFKTPSMGRIFRAESTGLGTGESGFLRLYSDRFGNLPVPMPTEGEQVAIVRFLAHAEDRVRRAIKAKHVMIARLEEQKQLIIYRAITRGLDSSVHLRASGVSWLGDVPAHWTLRKLKHLTRFHNGLPFKPADWKSSGTPIIRIQNLNGSDGFNYTTRTDLPAFLLIQRGDLLFSWSGNRGTSFGPFVWNRDFAGYLNQHIFKLAGFSLDRSYFAHLLRAVTRHIEEQTHGIIGLVHITKPELGSVVVPVAPEPEQVAIARWIDERLSELDVLVDRARRAIALLHSFNERLTTDVVSGAFDVRAAAKRLPTPALANEARFAASSDDDMLEVVDPVSEAEEVRA